MQLILAILAMPAKNEIKPSHLIIFQLILSIIPGYPHLDSAVNHYSRDLYDIKLFKKA